MQPYFLRRLLDGLLSTYRHKALVSVQPHPQLHDLQTALDTVPGQPDSDELSELSETASSDSPDALLSPSEEEEPAAAASPVAVAPPAGHAEQPTSAPTESASLQLSDQQEDAQDDSHTPKTSQSARPYEAEPSHLDAHEGCNSSRKRKAPDLSAEDRLDQAGAVHQYHTKLPHGLQLQLSPASRIVEGTQSAQHANRGQTAVDSVSPLAQAISAAERPCPQHAASITAEAGHAGTKGPLRSAAMQLLANAVADRLNSSEDQSTAVGKC